MSEYFGDLDDNVKHQERLKFLMRFFTIDLLIFEAAEENSSLFVFLSDAQELERTVYDCGENYLVRIK